MTGATHAPASGPPGRWIVSARFDLSLVALPALATLLVLLLAGAPPASEAGAPPLWAFLLLVVAFDVAHVWATLYISYLDPDARPRRRWLLWLTAPVALLVSYRLHLHSPALFWTVLAYVAIHHFIAQQWGFVALYRLRAGERSPVDLRLDRWTLWAGALGPVLLWHASPGREFDWFHAGERFLFRLDPALRPDILAGMVAIGAVWLGRQVQRAAQGEVNGGKWMWMVAAWGSWSLGLGLADHPLVALACINLLHGLPFLGLVWFRCSRRWAAAPAAAGPVAWLSRPRNLWAFYGVLLLLALGEEGLWDRYVWGLYLPDLTGLEPPGLSPEARSLVVALLALPQVVHYYLDAWLWKLDGSNPDLHLALGLPARRP